MTAKAELNPKSQKFDWRNSPAHLAFLATFIQPRPPDKHPTNNSWPLVLGELPEKAFERFFKDKVIVSCSPSQILAHELPKLTVKKLRELSRELALPTKDNKEILIQRLVQNRHPGLLLSVPNRYLVQCSDEGQRIVEAFLARGGEILEGADQPTIQTVKNVLLWLLKEGIVLGVVSGAAYDLYKKALNLLKELLSPEELKEFPPALKTPPAETPSPKPAPTPSPEITPPPKKTPAPKPPHRKQPFEPEMVHIPAGYFWMGSDEFDPEARTWEKPRHRVYLSEYWIGRYPVTNEEYRYFLLANPGVSKPYNWDNFNFPIGKAQHPVRFVGWEDTVAYCRWLSKATGYAYRLPTEAEWEKAARGTDGRIYPWGNGWDKNKCNSSEGGAGDTTPIGQYSQAGDSPYGCADMAGNVWEGCADWFDVQEYERRKGHSVEDPQGPENGDTRVLRGGAFDDASVNARCAVRDGYDPFYRSRYYGFRVGVGRPYLVSES